MEPSQVIDERIALTKERAPEQYVAWGHNGHLKLFKAGPCTVCEAGKYKDSTSGSSVCTDCPSGTYAIVASATANSSLCASCPSNSESPPGLYA